jgi:hypothetical protein
MVSPWGGSADLWSQACILADGVDLFAKELPGWGVEQVESLDAESLPVLVDADFYEPQIG